MKRIIAVVLVLVFSATAWVLVRKYFDGRILSPSVHSEGRGQQVDRALEQLSGPIQAQARSPVGIEPAIREPGIRGQVAYARGGWAEGERVRFFNQVPNFAGGNLVQAGDCVGESSTDKEGRFFWKRPLNTPPVVIRIDPRDTEFAGLVRAYCSPGQELSFWLQEAGAIEGRVIVNGVPSARGRIEVSTRQDYGTFVLQGVTPSDSGAYALSGLSPGQYVIEAILPGGTHLSQVLSVVGRGTTRQDFSFECISAFRGVVRGAYTLNPIYGAEVSLDRRFSHPVTTNENGEYVITASIEQGVFQINARAAGFVTDALTITTKDIDLLGIEVVPDIVLDMGSTVVGRIVSNRSSEPIENAEVTLVGFTPQREGALVSTGEIRATDADGRFEIDGVGAYVESAIVVSKPGFGRRVLNLPTVEQEQLDLGDVFLDSGGRVFGLVRAREATGTFEVFLELQPSPADLGPSRAVAWLANKTRVRTGPGGEYSFNDVPAGTHSVVARLPGKANHWEQRMEVDVPYAGAEVVANFDYSDGLHIRGGVIDPDGYPVSNVVVELVRESDRASAGIIAVGELGKFVFEGLQPGPYTASIRPTSSAPSGLRRVAGAMLPGIEAGQDNCVIRLSWATGVSGYVLDSNERLVPNAFVAAMQSGLLLDSTFTAEDGSFTLQVGQVFDLVVTTTYPNPKNPQRLKPDNNLDRQIHLFHVEPGTENLLVRFPFVVE